jgi:hypothetical protein
VSSKADSHGNTQSNNSNRTRTGSNRHNGNGTRPESNDKSPRNGNSGSDSNNGNRTRTGSTDRRANGNKDGAGRNRPANPNTLTITSFSERRHLVQAICDFGDCCEESRSSTGSRIRCCQSGRDRGNCYCRHCCCRFRGGWNLLHPLSRFTPTDGR